MAGLGKRMAMIIALCLYHELSCLAQVGVSSDSLQTAHKPGVFTNGFIDVMNSGQVNASARFLKIYLGEPGKISIPLSIYSGVSANNFRTQGVSFGQSTNDHLYAAFINPLSGIMNISADGIVFLKLGNQFSRVGFPFHFGERVLTGFRMGTVAGPQTARPVNFLNTFATTGLYFQTGAWEKNTARNIGLCWLVLTVHGCYTHPNMLRSFLPVLESNGIYTGYSVGFGVHINNLLNLRIVYYKYTKPPEIEYSLPVYQFTFNYSFRN